MGAIAVSISYSVGAAFFVTLKLSNLFSFYKKNHTHFIFSIHEEKMILEEAPRIDARISQGEEGFLKLELVIANKTLSEELLKAGDIAVLSAFLDAYLKFLENQDADFIIKKLLKRWIKSA